MFTCKLLIGPPEIEKEFSTVAVFAKINAKVVLICYGRSNTRVFYQWKKEKRANGRRSIPQTHGNALAVTIRFKDDFGVYLCNISNMAGSVVHKVKIVDISETAEEMCNTRRGEKGGSLKIRRSLSFYVLKYTTQI